MKISNSSQTESFELTFYSNVTKTLFINLIKAYRIRDSLFFLAGRLKNVKNDIIVTGKYAIVKYGNKGLVLCIRNLNAFKWYLPCGPATLQCGVPQPEQHSSSFGSASFCSIATATAFLLPGRAECHSLVQRQLVESVAADHQMVCLCGQIYLCNHTSILQHWSQSCGESSAIRVPFLCSACAALKDIIIPI